MFQGFPNIYTSIFGSSVLSSYAKLVWSLGLTHREYSHFEKEVIYLSESIILIVLCSTLILVRKECRYVVRVWQ